jgi:hypothetical protein
LPHPVRVSTTAWLVLAVVIVSCAFLISAHTPWLGLGDRTNTRFLRLLAEVRTPWLTDIALGIKAVGWLKVTVLGLSVVALTMIFRRWRHLRCFWAAVLPWRSSGSGSISACPARARTASRSSAAGAGTRRRLRRSPC